MLYDFINNNKISNNTFYKFYNRYQTCSRVVKMHLIFIFIVMYNNRTMLSLFTLFLIFMMWVLLIIF